MSTTRSGPPIPISGPSRPLTEAERLMEFNDAHDPHSGEFTSGGGGGSSSAASGGKTKGAVYQRGFSTKYAEQVSKEGLKPFKGAIYASTGEDVAHYYGVNQALVREKSNQYAVVSFRSDKAAKVYPDAGKSKKGDYVQERLDTFYKFDKAITPSQIVSVDVYEVDVKNPKAKPKLVKRYKESAQGELYHAAAIVNANGELEFLGPHRD